MLQKTTQFYIKLLKIRTDFEQLFFKKEYQALVGKSNSGLLLLGGILSFTLLALSLAIGSLEYLGERMDNPFTNWVDMPVNDNVKEQLVDIEDYFDTISVKQNFSLKNIGEYVTFTEFFLDNNKGERFFRKGRTLEMKDELLRKVLSPKDGNVLAGQTLSEDPSDQLGNPCGIIVTKKMLEGLGYENPLSQQKIPVTYDTLVLYLDIIAVVQTLPNVCDFALTPRMYNLLSRSYSETGLLNLKGKEYSLFFLAEEGDEAAMKQVVFDKLAKWKPYQIKQSVFIINTKKSHYLYELIFNEKYLFEERVQIIKELGQHFEKNAIRFYLDWECSDRFEHLKNPYYLAFNFKPLDEIEAFRDTMQSKFGIEVSMAQVEAKKNFSLVSWLTLLICIVLFIFGTASILFYVNSLLKTHLQTVKSDLGTLKAFGLNNDKLVNSYLKIIFTFLLLSTLGAVMMTAVITGLEEILLEDSYIKLLDYRIGLAIVLLLALSLFASRNTINKILSKSPGDLIYAR